MDSNFPAFLILFLPAILLEKLAIDIVTKRYTSKVGKFMQAGTVPNDQEIADGSVTVVNAGEHRMPKESIDLVLQNHHAVWQLRKAFVFISVVLAVIVSGIIQIRYAHLPFNWRVPYETTLMFTWLCVPIIATYERWSRRKTFRYSLLYAITAGVMALDLDLFKTLGMASLLFFSPRKSNSSFLTIVLFLNMEFLYLELYILYDFIGDGLLPLVEQLGKLINTYVLLIAWILLSSLLVFYQDKVLLKGLNAAYKNKLYSEPLFLFTGVWSIALMYQVFIVSLTLGLSAYGLLILWLLIPLSIRQMKPKLRPQHQPPTLLVLRLFRGDDRIQTLFDRVVEGWRYSGNTLMIDGSDLALHNLAPNDLLAFLSGQMKDTFISDENRLQQAVQVIDLKSDPDGRYRINEFFCFDNIWKLVLTTLVDKADRVLMDLRNYSSERKGCTHELTVLASKPHLQKIVILFNKDTEKQFVEQLLSGSAAKVIWIDCALHVGSSQDRALEALLSLN